MLLHHKLLWALLLQTVLFWKAPSASSFIHSPQLSRLSITHHQQQRIRSTYSHAIFSTKNMRRNNKYTLHLLASSSNLNNGSIEDRAKMAFDKFDQDGSGGISASELNDVLKTLEVEATTDETNALFSYLDIDGDGSISFEEFVPWYSSTMQEAVQVSTDFQDMLMSRRTVDKFDPSTTISDDVLRRAIKCAIAAPNRSGSEPWGFIKVGPDTVKELQALNARVVMAGGEEVTSIQQSAPLLPEVWTEIPGWCVVTTKLSPEDPVTELRDFRSTCCAIQNFMLSMWSEGLGSKWTEGPTQKTQQFADLCGIDTSKDRVAGIIWYGFPATGGLNDVDPKTQRKKDVDDVLKELP
mmetsp:Transcript_40179/g.47010  ORF Transcript_40179/g.47010 Transcript_40179/m.47010 type:complete len:353 (-) Transcript_40179:2-1060(-)